MIIPASPASTPSTALSRLRQRLSVARLRKAVVYLTAVGLLLIALWQLGGEVHAHLEALSGWIAGHGAVGMAVFVLVAVVGTSMLVPASLFGLMAGALFGLSLGLELVVTANLIAASLQYSLARTLLRDRVQAFVSDKPGLAAIQAAVLTDEVRLQALVRLTPLHAATTSYVLGAAGVRYPGFLLTTLCLLPHLLLEVYLGHAGAQASEVVAGHAVLEEAALVAGLVVSGLVLVVVSRAAKAALLQAVAEAPGPGDG